MDDRNLKIMIFFISPVAFIKISVFLFGGGEGVGGGA
jgi:hypothetical protein